MFLLLGRIPTITSVNDGKHMNGSKHYVNKAIDLRVLDMPKDMWQPVRNDLSNILGPDFDVILEKDHIHIEYDPK